jgi:hypothetical protein
VRFGVRVGLRLGLRLGSRLGSRLGLRLGNEAASFYSSLTRAKVPSFQGFRPSFCRFYTGREKKG